MTSSPEHRPTPEQTEDLTQRHIRSFGTRRGHLSPKQRQTSERLAPVFGVSYQSAALNLSELFGNKHPVTLEIGCGMGETTAAIAAANPNHNFLGLEVYPAGIGALLDRIETAGLTNVRVIAHDAIEVLQHMITPASLAGVNVFFPDPWHKKRHHKRRLIQASAISLIVSRLEIAGTIHCATDWVPYAEQMLEVLSAEPALENTAPGYHPRPDWRPLTKFENRGLKLGHEVRDLIFKRLR